jgi:RNA 2',3'-cyclic 3'-phosphodiesterase
MRIFLALNLPADLRHGVVEATAGLRAIAPQLSWVKEPLLHLTLKFLGDRTPDEAERVGASIVSVADRHREPSVRIGGVGAFPNFRRSRVVWLGVEQEPRLELVHHDVEVACEAMGFELDGRPFRPHVTLARVRRPLREPEARALAREAKAVDFSGDWVIRSIDLMQSELSPAGPSYTTLVSAPLRSG